MMEGRKAGSEGEQAAAEYLETVLQGYGVDILSAKGGDTFGIRTAPSSSACLSVRDILSAPLTSFLLAETNV